MRSRRGFLIEDTAGIGLGVGVSRVLRVDPCFHDVMSEPGQHVGQDAPQRVAVHALAVQDVLGPAGVVDLCRARVTWVIAPVASATDTGAQTAWLGRVSKSVME